jgi:transcriptional regulator with XRE-family HTH domain
METGEGIKKFRDRARYNTQTDLAKALEIKPGNVSLWEAGNGYPSFLVAKKLLELGITVEELFGVEYIERHYNEEQAKRQQAEKERKQAEIERLGKLKFEEIVEIMNKTTAKLDDARKIKERNANDYFNIAKQCIEKENVDKEDVIRYFKMLASYYSILAEIEKELDSTDIERLNNLNDFIENKCKKEWFEEVNIEDFCYTFESFVIYCYRNYYHREEGKYFNKVIEVSYNLDNKINRRREFKIEYAGKKRSLSEYAEEFAKWVEINGYG